MSIFLWTNNAVTTLASAITATATSISLTSGSGALFPSPTTGQYFSLTIQSASNQSILEIVYCTARSGDVLTVIRAQEGTSATAFNAGDNASLLLTAGQLNGFVQIPHMTDATIAPIFGNTTARGTLTTTGAASIGGSLGVSGNVNASGNGFFGSQVSFSSNNCGIFGPDLGNVLRTMISLDGNNVDAWTGSAGFRVLRASDAAQMFSVDTSGDATASGAVTASGNVIASGGYLRATYGARNNPTDGNAAAINTDFALGLTTNGAYFVMPRYNGEFILQGGVGLLNNQNVTFPIPFPNACLSVVCSEGAAYPNFVASPPNPTIHGVSGFTNTYWVHYGVVWNGSNGWTANPTLTTNWIAIGY